MTWTVYHEGADRSAYVDITTMRIDREVGFRRDTAQLTFYNLDTSITFRAWQPVEIWRGAVLEFGGVLMAFDVTDRGVRQDVAISCADWGALLDARITGLGVTYTAQTAGAIVRDLMLDYCTEITATAGTVLDGQTIDEITFDYETLAEAINQLAQASGFTYFVQQEALAGTPILYFQAPTTEDAPFNLSTQYLPAGPYEMRVTRWGTDGTQLRNKFVITHDTGAVTYNDAASQAAYGYTLEMARNVQADASTAQTIAEGLALAYSDQRETGSVTCWQDGLQVGQRIKITHSALGLDDFYTIQRMTIRPASVDTTVYDLKVGEVASDWGLIDRLRAGDGGQGGGGSNNTTITQAFVGRREGPHVGMFSTTNPTTGTRNIYLQAVDTANVPFFSVGSQNYRTNTQWIRIGYEDAKGIRLKAPTGAAGSPEDHPDMEIDAECLVGDLPPGIGWGDITAADVSIVDIGDYFDATNVEDALQYLASIVGAGSHEHVINEDHTLECDGSKTRFITIQGFELGTTQVWLNGLLQRPGPRYTEDEAQDAVTFVTAPETGDELLISYIVSVAVVTILRQTAMVPGVLTGAALEYSVYED